MPTTLTRTSTTDMEVTSIRLERELKEQLKAISGSQGYQALIRDILWNYVQQKSSDFTPNLSPNEIRATIEATAQHEERCAITGRTIRSGEEMLLGFTSEGNLIPLSLDSLG
jgi:metal-responsive CopG/Arc/MetJ family transcriptional regulator